MRTKNPIIVFGPDGRPLAGAQVYTRVRATGADAAVYAAETGAGPGANPSITGADGRPNQWLERGAYASTVTPPAGGLAPYVESWDSAPASDGSVDTAWMADKAATVAKVDVVNMQLVGTYAARPAAAAALNGVSYTATDKGMEWLCVAGAWVLIGVTPLEVTALPAAPIDRQEIHYLADAALGIVWHLRYRAASASAYKWEHVGFPAALRADTDVSETSNAAGAGNAWNNLVTPCSLVVPVAGDYEVGWQAALNFPSAGASAYGYVIPNVVQADSSTGLAITGSAQSGDGLYVHINRTRTLTLAAGQTVNLQSRWSNNGHTNAYKSLTLRPRRVG
jgi:hypothetical protein